MLTRSAQDQVLAAARRRWTSASAKRELAKAVPVKGVSGRALGSWVESETVTALEAAFGSRATWQVKKDDARSTSSIGDVWVKSAGIFNPVNIKTSLVKPTGAGGSPNIVSLTKLTKAVFQREIDSYYLLLVHIVNDNPPSAHCHLVDLLHIINDYVRFDSGHGQLMLNASAFDKATLEPRADVVDAKEALVHLQEVRKQGNERLIRKRAADLRKMKRDMASFDGTTAITQESLPLAALIRKKGTRA